MKPRFILLLALMAVTVTFMAFLVREDGAKISCEKSPCCKKAVAPPAESGGGGMDDGSFKHLIVSTIK
jgi:hypothetical protein